ncbi:MAG: endolytic transglycosylase MltG [Deltaproteobacteria bacterium]|nr:endolytic transglycosylase MltG [Deltaproteobacteria bacterium]
MPNTEDHSSPPVIEPALPTEDAALTEPPLPTLETPAPPSPPSGPSTLRRVGRLLWRMMQILGIFVVLGLIAGFVALLEYRSYLMPVSVEARKLVVEIPQGANVRQIGHLLEEAGAIRSADAFYYYVALRRVGPKLKAGEQIVDTSMNTPEIIDSLIKGNFKLYSLTIPEGRNMAQIAILAAKTGLADEREFLEFCRNREFIASLGLDEITLEGYLFPETYNFTKSNTAKDIIKTMTDRFKQVWDRYKNQANIQGLTRHQVITLASIIEKETAEGSERPMVARVFINRLKKGMRLETDPTVIYGIKDFTGPLTKKDLQTPTPYNTYVITGLPPGPISNPSEDSIRAVLEPAIGDYIYFVSKNDGTHHFSKTLAEHNKAVDQYQRSQRPKQ